MGGGVEVFFAKNNITQTQGISTSLVTEMAMLDNEKALEKLNNNNNGFYHWRELNYI